MIDDRDPIAVLGLVHVVRREEDRDRLAAPKLLDVAPDVGSRLRIEAHGRFVEEQDPRGVQQTASDLQAPLHPTGVRGDHASASLPELDHLEDVAQPLLGEVSGYPIQLGVEPQVLLGRQVLVERRVLEDQTDVPSDVGRMRRHIETGDLRPSGRRAKQRTQDVDRRGFPGPVRAEEAEGLPDRDIERDVIDRGDVIEDLAEALNEDGGPVVHATSPRGVSRFVMTARSARRPDRSWAASIGVSAPISLAAIAR